MRRTRPGGTRQTWRRRAVAFGKKKLRETALAPSPSDFPRRVSLLLLARAEALL